MYDELRDALNTIIDIQDAQGLNRKKELLKRRVHNETLKNILYFVFNPYIKTGIRLAKFKKFEVLELAKISYYGSIENYFEYLKQNNTGRDNDIVQIKVFINGIIKNEIQSKRFNEILISIFTKTLKLGISTTTINKIWPNLIPGFGIQLACKWRDNICMLQNNIIYITEKLDGNRCFANVKDGDIIFYSRSGREIEGLDDIKEELCKFNNGWYDGELLADTFNDTQSIVRTKGKKENLIFNIFDFVTNEEVENQIGCIPYSLRRRSLFNQFIKFDNLKYIKLVPIIFEGVFDEEYVNTLLSEYTSNGSEGLMINIDKPYQFGRTNYLLKVKKMQTLDLEVINIAEGSGEFAGMVGALVVDYKGFPVGVGSGIEKEDRIYWWNNKDEIIGRVIEVQYFEETINDDNSISLRFPVFIRVRDIDKEVSYN